MGVRWRLVAVSAAMMALLGACASGGDGGNKVASLSDPAQPSNSQQAGDGKTDEDQMREFAGCMREHGIDMKDPTSGPNGGGISMEVNGDNADKMKAADEACRHLLPNGGQPPKLDAAQLDKLRELAKCLREHGLDVKDPDANNPGIQIQGGPDQQKFEEAHKACGMLDGPGSFSVEGGDK
jgi:hypothetical protein